MTPFYRDREDWSDLTPIPQNDAPNAVCTIAYDEEYVDAMDYFRAISMKQEFSERALELTGKIITFNPAHYTIWKYRQECLFALNTDLDVELQFVDEIAEDNPKSYQIWHHRQVLTEHYNPDSPLAELQFVGRFLTDDSKNYHAWTYRQWLIRRFSVWEDELDFCNKMVELDVRNNSAWNQRWFVLSASLNGETKEFSVTIEEELDYALAKLSLAPNNESAWNYLQGLVRLANKRGISGVDQRATTFAMDLRSRGSVAAPVHSFLVEMLEIINSEDAKSRATLLEILDDLSQKFDTVRAKYWQFRKQNIVL
ncbi:farnesyltransferase, CAAX box, alpha [Gonapodya prolifera JEL478]|uniref:Protein farnesyltransferase/geranylgeranyltransferase type-1 subunit alpha n=1 Tax=Gonapodya prolifera (strain JEL478) TaxID=1344416 RepID=A0A139AIZ2_GONPJ|nr:farnesyltransferase, CAAX box, alpha [Gonapodya prolifera JEL478]|eukprot:KXS16766.1 farnesyltransferase, CAAX box, alpha [Gonapodya prolifera JEL478]